MNTLSQHFTILAIETSCDETAAAVVRGGREVVSNIVSSQMDMHRRYGGVVPEVASRQHILSLIPVIEEAVSALPGGWNDIDALAATYGPGLSGALLTGLNAAKALAWQREIPFVGVNHLEAHIYANWLDGWGKDAPQPEFPVVALVVSGGHTLLALLRDHGDYQILGQTRDDAVGEAFDKVARILGLGYPGGPAIQKAAEGGAGGPSLPRAWLRDSYDFSFSGLKTAVLHRVQERRELAAKVVPPPPSPRERGRRVEPPAPRPETPSAPVALPAQFVAQTAHAFQESVVDVLVSKAVDAAQQHGATEIILAGGVAANSRLRAELTRRAKVPVRYPPLSLCTDNAAMVAAAAFYRYESGVRHGLEVDVQPNLRLGM